MVRTHRNGAPIAESNDERRHPRHRLLDRLRSPRSARPVFGHAAAASADRGMQFARVNVDASAGVATAFQIQSIPTVIVLDRFGHEIDRQVGVPSRRRLDQLIRRAEALAAVAGVRGAA